MPRELLLSWLFVDYIQWLILIPRISLESCFDSLKLTILCLLFDISSNVYIFSPFRTPVVFQGCGYPLKLHYG